MIRDDPSGKASTRGLTRAGGANLSADALGVGVVPLADGEGVGAGVQGAGSVAQGVGSVVHGAGVGVGAGSGGGGALGVGVGSGSVLSAGCVGVGSGVHTTGTGGRSTGVLAVVPGALVAGAPSESTGGNHGVKAETVAASRGVSRPVTVIVPVLDVVTRTGSLPSPGRGVAAAATPCALPPDDAGGVGASAVATLASPVEAIGRPRARTASDAPPRASGSATTATSTAASEARTGSAAAERAGAAA